MNRRDAARGRPCTIRLPGCDGGGESTVLCHYPGHRFGNGMGTKSHDVAAAFGCANCHAIVDGQRRRPDWMDKTELRLAFAEAVIETNVILEGERE